MFYSDGGSGYSDDEDEDILPIGLAMLLSCKKQKFTSHLQGNWYYHRCELNLFDDLAIKSNDNFVENYIKKRGTLRFCGFSI